MREAWRPGRGAPRCRRGVNRVVGSKGLEALLETIRSWLERAGDDELLAMHAVVRAEMERRRLRPRPTPPREEEMD